MSTQFMLPSSDPALYEKATRIAHEFAQQSISDELVGIVFLGAITRGYFARAADVDISLMKKAGSAFDIPNKFFNVDGIEVHCWLSEYESECTATWDMAKRWTFAQGQIYYDPTGKIAQLLAEKVPLQPEEKRWLLMSGLVLSEWYINGLSRLWVDRGNLISAHHMFGQGVNFFFDMLSGLNNQLVADMKWRYYCVEQFERLPQRFPERMQEIMMLHAVTLEELDRRQAVFMAMWREMQPVVEAEVKMSFDEMVQLV